MSDSLLASLRKAKSLSQEQLGTRVAKRLGRSIGIGYAQKKIARFEAGTAIPTVKELEALAQELGVSVEALSFPDASEPVNEGAVSVIDKLTSAEGERRLMAICSLSRPRLEPIDESYKAIKKSVEEKHLAIAVFIPYPNVVRLQEPSDDISLLQGSYIDIRKRMNEANLNFTKGLTNDGARSVALYLPKAELINNSSILIPPVVNQQYSLTIQQAQRNGPTTKSLHTWTPGVETDIARQVKGTGVYSIAEQITLWESFFGRIVPHWIEEDEFLASDAYWERVR